MPDVKPPVPLLKSGKYALFWSGSLLSNIGYWMQQVAEPWLMLSLGGSSFLVGLDSFALTGPGWFLTIWGGFLADRYNRKHIVLFFQFIQMIAVAIIIALLYFGLLTPWMLVAASLFSGITDSLSMPALQTLVPSLVGKEELPKAISLNSLQFNISRMVGPGIAGFAMAKFGAIACFSGNFLTYLPLFFAVVLIYPKKSQQRQLHQLTNKWRPRLQDFTSVLKNNSHRRLLVSVFINGVMVAPTLIFVPVLMKEVFHGQVEYLGVIMAAAGVGGLFGALFGAKVVKLMKNAKGLLLFPIFSGGLVALIAINQNLVVLGLGIAVLGAATAILAVATNSKIQMDSEDHQLGRAASFFQLAMQGGMAIGGLWTGILSQALGIHYALLINGVACVVLQLILLMLK